MTSNPNLIFDYQQMAQVQAQLQSQITHQANQLQLFQSKVLAPSLEIHDLNQNHFQNQGSRSQSQGSPPVSPRKHQAAEPHQNQPKFISNQAKTGSPSNPNSNLTPNKNQNQNQNEPLHQKSSNSQHYIDPWDDQGEGSNITGLPASASFQFLQQQQTLEYNRFLRNGPPVNSQNANFLWSYDESTSNGEENLNLVSNLRLSSDPSAFQSNGLPSHSNPKAQQQIQLPQPPPNHQGQQNLQQNLNQNNPIMNSQTSNSKKKKKKEAS